MDGRLQLRNDTVAFMGLPPVIDGGAPTFRRMQGFTTLSVSKNPREYSRQYVDESQEQTDVVGYSPSMEFGFDKYVGNAVHDFVAEIIDNEVIGTPAVVNILTVDMTKDPVAGNNATLRPFAVIANTEGDSMDAYTYSGTFAVKGAREVGTSIVSADGLTADWTPAATPTP